MASLSIYPSYIYSDQGYWVGNAAVLSEVGSYATKASSLGNDNLYILGFQSKSLPKNITITGIEVEVAGKASASASMNLRIMTGRDVPTATGNTKTLSFTTSLSTGTAGGSSDMWGASPLYYELYDNANLGVLLTTTTANKTYYLDYVIFRIYYTTQTYLTGNRSLFSSRSNNLRDVLYSATTSLNNLNPVYNGHGLIHQVKSEDVNKLGDCLYQTENVIHGLTTSGIVSAGGAPLKANNYVFTVTVTGTTTGASSLVYQQNVRWNVDTNTTHNQVITNLSSTKRSPNPALSTPLLVLNCYNVSAIGWVTNGGTNYPLWVQPYSLRYSVNSKGHLNYDIGFIAMKSDWIKDNTTNTVSGYQGVKINTVESMASGIVTVKLMGIARGGV